MYTCDLAGDIFKSAETASGFGQDGLTLSSCFDMGRTDRFDAIRQAQDVFVVITVVGVVRQNSTPF